MKIEKLKNEKTVQPLVDSVCTASISSLVKKYVKKFGGTLLFETEL